VPEEDSSHLSTSRDRAEALLRYRIYHLDESGQPGRRDARAHTTIRAFDCRRSGGRVSRITRQRTWCRTSLPDLLPSREVSDSGAGFRGQVQPVSATPRRVERILDELSRL
jgi:hypothetical protein